MKLRCKFVINCVAGENIAVPVGKEAGFKGYIRLNETGRDIFELLRKETTREKVISSLQKKYPDGTAEEITESVDDIIGKLASAGFLI
ncbi:MAG: PqqD family protein [Clostridia bacterium]|nr:PqqD family protein [Clostridia bacterium]